MEVVGGDGTRKQGQAEDLVPEPQQRPSAGERTPPTLETQEERGARGGVSGAVRAGVVHRCRVPGWTERWGWSEPWSAPLGWGSPVSRPHPPRACPQFPRQHLSEASRTLSTSTQDLGPR